MKEPEVVLITGTSRGIGRFAVGPAPIERNLIRGVPPKKINRVINNLAIKRLVK